MKKIIKCIFIACFVLISGAPSLLPAQDIYWVESVFDSPRLVKSDTSGSELLSKALPKGSLPQSIVLDESGNSLLWTGLSFVNAQINKTSSDFTGSSAVVNSQSALRGIAVDPINKKIYWTSTNLIDGPKIWRANLDGTSQEVLIDFGPASDSTPRSISLDINAGKMYWTNFGEGTIQRADMSSGAIPEDIISSLKGPSGLAVDADSGKIFWTEMNGHQIRSASLNGNNPTVLVDGLSYPNFLSVNRSINRMAWTEMGTGKIKSAALDGTDIVDYKVVAKAPTGIAIVPSAPINGELVIIPPNRTMQVHNFFQFDTQIIDTFGMAHEADATSWSVKKDRVGPISNDGLLYAYFPGKAKIMAKLDSMVAKTYLTVVDTTADSSGVNKVKFVVRFFDKEWEIKTIKEGETFIVGGIPHPFNIINGSMLYFPMGSLHEDVTAAIRLPKFCKIKADTVEFIDRIIMGLQFDVFAGDSLIEPYYFDRPVSVSMKFKRGVLKKLGIDPANLSMFFALDSTTFDTLGISHVIVDTSDSRIYGLVEHFSSIVVREDVIVTSSKADNGINIIPDNFELKQNYPNPFNPTTTISYQLARHSKVELSIYNMLGQKVVTLLSGKQQAGTYNLQWDASGFASGVYLYRLETDQGFVKTRKLILLK